MTPAQASGVDVTALRKVELGRQDRCLTLRTARQSFSDNPLTLVLGVDVRRVNEVDAAVERLVDDFTVEDDFEELGVLDLLPLGIETRCGEVNLELIPLTRRLRWF